MKRFLLTLFLALLLSADALPQTSPPNSLGSIGMYDTPFAPIIFQRTLALSSATTTEVTGGSVANATATKRYYVYSRSMATTVAGTGATLKLVYGTGTNCGTGNND